MILQKFNAIFIVLPCLLTILFLLWLYFKKSNKYIFDYWFFKPTVASCLSVAFLFVAFVFLGVALLDLRGEEEKITAQIPDQKTIILIDSSLSMLVEDVRPNRFLKSIQVARHFVKNSAANQFSVFIFSDTYQRILPFTDDIDLVDSRLAALESLATVKGSSNIAFTIKGMISYFQTENNDNPIGNILLFTDGEEHEREEKISVPSGISLAVIGIGTVKGGQIPIRWSDGSFKGFKTVSGTPVNSRLNEEYIKNLGSNVKDFEYWIVNSFNLPTSEIHEFFKQKFTNGGNVGEVRTRKAYGEYPILFFVASYILSVIFSRFKTFKIASLVIACVIFFSFPFFIANLQASEEKKLSVSTLEDLDKIKQGTASKSEILKTAEKLLKEGFPESAKKLYEEHSEAVEGVEVENNYGVSLLKGGLADKAIAKFRKILSRPNLTESQSDAVRRNLLAAIQQQKSNEKQDQNKKENSDKKNNEGGNKQNDQGNGEKKGQESSDSKEKNENNDSNKGKSNESKDNQKDKKEGQDLRDLMNKKEDKKEKDEQENKKNKQQKNDHDKKNENDQEKESSPETFEEKEERMRKQKKMKKTPAILRQTLDLDRELQKKFLDASRERVENGEVENKPSKDW